jgi:hypothetical protein
MINGLAVFIMLCMMFMWLGTKWRKRLVGFGLLTDISIHILLQAFLGGDGEGRLAVLFGGVMFNLFLMLYRKVWGYSTIEGGQWVLHRGWFFRPKAITT